VDSSVNRNEIFVTTRRSASPNEQGVDNGVARVRRPPPGTVRTDMNKMFASLIISHFPSSRFTVPIWRVFAPSKYFTMPRPIVTVCSFYHGEAMRFHNTLYTFVCEEFSWRAAVSDACEHEPHVSVTRYSLRSKSVPTLLTAGIHVDRPLYLDRPVVCLCSATFNPPSILYYCPPPIGREKVTVFRRLLYERRSKSERVA